MKDKKYYQHCDDDFRADCAEMVLTMDTDQIEFFAKELLNIVDERRRAEREKEIKLCLTAITENIQALHKMGMAVEIGNDDQTYLFKPDPYFPPIVQVKKIK